MTSLVLTSPCLCAKEAIYEQQSHQKTVEEVEKGSFICTYDRVQQMEITPQAGPVVSHGADVYIEADYMYWYASQQGLNYVGSNFYYNQSNYFKDQEPVSGQQFPKGRVYTPGNKASSGFKVGMGMDFDYDGWDLRAVYTWYRNHHRNEVSAPLNADGSISSNLTPIIYQEYYEGSHLTQASADFKLALNVIDVELGRDFFISPKLTFRPSIGLKSSWGHQHFVIDETLNGELKTLYPLTNGTSADLGQSLYTTTNSQGNWGFGVRGAIDMGWHVTQCFSFFGLC